MYIYTKKKVKIAYICVEVIIAQKLQRYLIMKYVLYCLERHRLRQKHNQTLFRKQAIFIFQKK